MFRHEKGRPGRSRLTGRSGPGSVILLCGMRAAAARPANRCNAACALPLVERCSANHC